jgi:amino acid transporter/nucleotide-binding universal stress UspA family protein
MEINVGVVRRPRNVDWKRAAALLYGDWGTSKAYVTGLAFAAAAYSSFWLILGVSILTAIVGINYVWVCKYFPEGGGVYSSARHHSRKLALIGGFFLVANYIVTAAISSFEAFHYFGVSDQARRWAIVAIFAIGILNFWGPRHSGMIAMVLAVPTVIIVIILAFFSLPYLDRAHVAPPPNDVWKNWTGIVGVILALSGVESIANMTGLMKKDPGSSDAHPTVTKTASKAIWINMIEVCFFTTFFGYVMLAMPMPGEHVESMLRHIGMVVGGEWLGIAVSIVFGCLLLSAVNTAMMSMVSVLYLMTDDDELPRPFALLNRYGVPWILMLIAILIPVFVTDAVGNLKDLASLYAIGVVGAIMINLASCAFNFTLPMPKYERVIMLGTAGILLAIELTIAITMPHALVFIILILLLGFTARGIHKAAAPKQGAPPPSYAGVRDAAPGTDATLDLDQTSGGKILAAVRGITPSLKFAIEEARCRKSALYILYVREIAVAIPAGPTRWQDDPVARDIFENTRLLAEGVPVIPVYANSNLPADTIVEMACLLGVDFLVLGTSERSGLVNFMKGNVVQEVIRQLPENVHVLIYG